MLAALLLAAAACGGGDGGEEAGDGGPEPSAADVGAALSERAAETAESTTSTASSAESPSSTASGGRPTTTTTAPPEIELPVVDVAAPAPAPDGFDACESPTTFGAGNLVDGAEDTAWRTPGDATGQAVTITLDGTRRVRSVGLVPGYVKVDPCDATNRFAQNRRPTAVTWVFDDGTEVAQPLSDQPAGQTVEVDERTRTIQLRIDGVTGNPERDFTAISEVTVRGY